MLKINTLIIGGGISGLSTAYNLKKGGFSDFKIITEDIGGRVCFSKDGNVQYGAYYVMEKIYVNTRKFLKLGRKINRSEMFYHKRGETYTILQLSFIKYIPQLIRLIFLLLKFKRHYIKFKKESCFRPQDEVIKSDPYLLYVYETNAEK
ncbi:MAG: FAD/NAD(P)-binding protein, partial [bacterium]